MKTFDAEIPSVREILEFICREAEKQGFDPLAVNTIEVAVEEVVTNIMAYAYRDTPTKKGLIECECTPLENRRGLKISIQDEGTPYNPLKNEKVTTPPKFTDQTPLGGVGIFLVLNLMDEVDYTHKNDKNILTLTKYA